MFRLGPAVLAHGNELDLQNLSELTVSISDYDGLKRVASEEFELSLDGVEWANEIEVDMTGVINAPVRVRATSSTNGKVIITDA